MADKVDQAVVDEFRRGSWLLDNISFDNTVSPGTGGSTLVYGYIRRKVPSVAQFRPINTEYTAQETIRERLSQELKIFGGKFELDRVIINTAGAVDELNDQMTEKIKGAVNLFHYTVINGDSAVDPDQFDGLDVFITGSSTEFNAGGAPIDISTSALMDANYNEFLDMMTEFESGLDGRPDAFLVNTRLATKIKGVARRAGYYTRAEDAFGRPVDTWSGIPIIDMMSFYDESISATVPVVPIDTATGTTSLYAVIFGVNAFHAASPVGDRIITTAFPDLSAPGVMKEGDVEMVTCVVLKNTLKAGAFREIKVTP